MFPNQKEIDFNKLIKKYKAENFKRMKVINHEFLYSCFHPTNEDVVICLEKNSYPSDVHIYNLHENMDESIGESHDFDNENVPSDNRIESMGRLLDNNVDLEESKILDTQGSHNPLQKLLTLRQQDKKKSEFKSMVKIEEVLLSKLIVQQKDEKKADLKKVAAGFEFNKDIKYNAYREASKIHQYKYAISLWKINKGGNPMQFKEYGFNGCPLDSKFHVSQDGKMIYFFLQVREYPKAETAEIRRVVILSMDNLREWRIVDLASDFKECDIHDQALLKGGNILYIHPFHSRFYFFNTSSGNIMWQFGNQHCVEQEQIIQEKEEEEEEEKDKDDTLQYYGDDTGNMKTWEILQIMFLDDQSDVIFPFVKTENDEIQFYQIKLHTKFESFFDQSNLVWKKECQVTGYDLKLSANKNMQQFLLKDAQSLQVFNIDYRNKKPKTVRKMDFCQYYLIQKNSWLYEEIMVSACNQNNEAIVFSANNYAFQLELIDHIHEVGQEPQFFDVRKSKQGETLVIGQPQSKQGIVINYFDRESEDPTISYIQEISEYKCLYPYVFYCKGNAEIFIHCIYHPTKLYRLQLKDGKQMNQRLNQNIVFVCFLDTSPQFEAMNLQIRENETIAYLSLRKGGRIHMNVLQFNHFEQPGQFNLMTSIQSINRKEFRFGSVVKACVVKADRKEMKGGSDYILIMQYRTQIVMKSFISTYSFQIEKGSMIPVPMLYLTNIDYKDEIYFLQRDGLSIKLQQIKFKKDQKEAITNYYDFKSSKIYLFTYHEGSFYIMDESLSIREFKIDPKAEKVKFYRTLEMTSEDKQDFQTTEFEKISITDGVLYQGNQCYILHESTDNQKNHDMLTAFQIFECDVVQGPTKINGTKNLMFVSKQSETLVAENESFKKASMQNQKTQRQKTRTFKTEKQKQISDIKESTLRETNIFKGEEGPKGDDEEFVPILVDYIEEDSANLVENLAEERKNAKSDYQNNEKICKSIGSFISNKNRKDAYNDYILDGDDEDQNIVEVTFAPYIDDNEIWFTYHETAFNMLPYPKVDFSTFIGKEEENILVEIKNKFVMFTKSGKFLYNVEFYQGNNIIQYSRDTYKLLTIDDNTVFFLFQISLTELNIFKLKQRENWNYIFVFFKDIPRYQQIEGEETYFNQVYINTDGLVYQVQETVNTKYNNTIYESDQELSNIFKLYCDEQHCLQDLPLKFESIQHLKRRKNRGTDAMEFVIVGEYLFLKQGRRLEYFKIFNNLDYHKDEANELNLKLDDNVEIKRILSTEKPHLIQIIFQIVDQSQGHLYIMTWDLKKNIEFSLLEVQDLEADKPENLICKGMKEKLNYIVTNNNFFDLFYLVPLRFVKAEDDFGDLPLCRNEKKVSSDLSAYLGMGFRNTVHMTHTLLDLYYGSVFTLIKMEDITTKDIKLEHFEPRYDSSTLFHEYALNQKVLFLILEETKRVMNEHGKSKAKEVLFAIIYPNKFGQSPFDIAIKNSSPKNIEVMLEMLILLSEFRLSQFIKKHISTLFSMQLNVFEKYLSSCFFKHKSMQETKTLEWFFEEDEAFVDFHTSYLGDEFYEKLLNYRTAQYYKQLPVDKLARKTFSPTKNDEDKPARMTLLRLVLAKHLAKMKTNVIFNELDLYDESNTISVQEDKFRRIEISALEFDWIFEGDSATNFIKRLANTDNDDLFAIPSIKVIVLFLWEKFFYKIRNKVFYPFLTYMIFFLLYVTFIYETSKENPDSLPYWRLDLFFVSVVLAFIAFFMLFECKQIYLQKRAYFESLWNNVDILSFALNLTFVTCDICNLDTTITRPIGSVAVWLMWVKLFYFLRLFRITAPIVRMLMQILKDMGIFSFVFLLALLGFGNSFYLLAKNNIDSVKCSDEVYLSTASDDELKRCAPFTGGNFLFAIIHAFRTGLGDFQTDQYSFGSAAPLNWIAFLACAILIQIVLLNMIIAIMADTFNKVTNIAEQSKLKEICSLIAENEFILQRKSEFKNSKYIIIARLEQAGIGEATLEGKLATFKSQFQTVVNDLRIDGRNQTEGTKEELIANFRATDQKQQNVQQKQTLQIAQITKDLKEMGSQVSHIKDDLRHLTRFLNVPKVDDMITQKILKMVPLKSEKKLLSEVEE